MWGHWISICSKATFECCVFAFCFSIWAISKSCGPCYEFWVCTNSFCARDLILRPSVAYNTLPRNMIQFGCNKDGLRRDMIQFGYNTIQIYSTIRATRGRNQIVFTHKLKFIKTSAYASARASASARARARAHASHYSRACSRTALPTGLDDA